MIDRITAMFAGICGGQDLAQQWADKEKVETVAALESSLESEKRLSEVADQVLAELDAIQIADLRKQLNAAFRANKQLQQKVAKLETSETSETSETIETIQKELQAITNERNQLQAQLEAEQQNKIQDQKTIDSLTDSKNKMIKWLAEANDRLQNRTQSITKLIHWIEIEEIRTNCTSESTTNSSVMQILKELVKLWSNPTPLTDHEKQKFQESFTVTNGRIL